MTKMKLVPGFRFHPMDDELVKFFLKRKVMGKKLPDDVIAEVNVYKHAPWDLPDKSCLKTGDLEWYFFSPIEKKYCSGGRMNRATEIGHWKVTGKDRAVLHNNQVVGMRKTLIFHMGKAPRGDRTDWVMHEYRLEDKGLADKGIAQDSYVICKVFQKEGPGPRNGAQYGRPFNEEDWNDEEIGTPFVDSSAPVPISSITFNTSVPNDQHLLAGGCTGSTSTSCLTGMNDEEIGIPFVDSSAPVPISSITYNTSVPNDQYLLAGGCTGSTSTSCLTGMMPSPGLEIPSPPSNQAGNSDDDILSMLDIFKEDTLPEENITEGAPSIDYFEDLGNLDSWDAAGFSSVQNVECLTNGMATTGDVSGFGDLDFLELIDLDSPLFWQPLPENWSPDK